MFLYLIDVKLATLRQATIDCGAPCVRHHRSARMVEINATWGPPTMAVSEAVCKSRKSKTNKAHKTLPQLMQYSKLLRFINYITVTSIPYIRISEGQKHTMFNLCIHKSGNRTYVCPADHNGIERYWINSMLVKKT